VAVVVAVGVVVWVEVAAGEMVAVAEGEGVGKGAGGDAASKATGCCVVADTLGDDADVSALAQFVSAVVTACGLTVSWRAASASGSAPMPLPLSTKVVVLRLAIRPFTGLDADLP
jgi:hypothetical protein